MRRYRDDRDLLRLRPVTPKNPIRPRRAILRVRFKNLPILVVWICERQKLVGLQPRMPGIGRQQINALFHLLEQSFRLGALSRSAAFFQRRLRIGF